jgi:hypothetical protein
MNPYHVGIGGFVTVSLYVIILAFLWRSVAAMFAGSENPTLQTLGGAMGSSL